MLVGSRRAAAGGWRGALLVGVAHSVFPATTRFASAWQNHDWASTFLVVAARANHDWDHVFFLMAARARLGRAMIGLVSRRGLKTLIELPGRPQISLSPRILIGLFWESSHMRQVS